MEGGSKRGRIASYNALKGLGAVGILFSHMSYLGAAENPFWWNFHHYFMRYGAVCSSFFFLCSGFLLHYTWKEGTGSGGHAFGVYLKKKLKRLYPLALFVFLLAVGVELLMPGNGVVTEGMQLGSPLWLFCVAANLLLFKAFIPDRRVFYSFHGPSWYISVLFFFYAAAFAFVRGLKSGTEESRARWRRATLICCAAAYTIELVICVAVDRGVGGLENHSLYLTYVNPYFRIFGEGFAGILLCEYMPRISRAVRKCSADLLEICGIAAFLCGMLLKNVIHTSLMNAWLQSALMGFVLIAFRSDAGRVSGALKRRPFQLLGDISFELYMTHAFVYEGLPVAAGIVSGAMRGWLIAHAGTRFVITFVLCVVFAWIVHFFLEQLTRKVLARV